MRGKTGRRKMNYRNIVLAWACLSWGSLLFPAAGADARSAYLSAFTTKYTATVGTKLDDCNTCHGSGGTSTWNPYGQAIRSLGSAVAIATRITNVEPLDSDGDGIINVTEINGLTFPGDPSDPPVAVAPTITTASSVARRYGGDGVQPDVYGHRGHDAAHVVGVRGDASRGPEPLLGGRAERHADDGGGL